MNSIEEIKYRRKILFEVYEALIGNITANMRMISLRWNEDSIDIRVIFSLEPSDEDKEIVSDIMGEVISGFPNVKSCKEFCIQSSLPLSELAPFGEVIFKIRENKI